MKNAGNNPKPEVDGAILPLLTEHRGGEILTELSAAMRVVAEAVQLIGKSGTITLKLKFAVAQGTSNTLVISDKVTAKLPEAEKRGSIFYVDHNFNLVRNDPNQFEMKQVIDVAQAPVNRAPAVDVQRTNQAPVDVAAR